MLLMFNLHKVSALLKGSPSPPQAVHCMCKATVVAIRMVESGGGGLPLGRLCLPATYPDSVLCAADPHLNFVFVGEWLPTWLHPRLLQVTLLCLEASAFLASSLSICNAELVSSKTLSARGHSSTGANGQHSCSSSAPGVAICVHA